jgi:hypothetical protein
MSMTGADSSEQHTTTLTEITSLALGAQPESLFVVPAGYTRDTSDVLGMRAMEAQIAQMREQSAAVGASIATQKDDPSAVLRKIAAAEASFFDAHHRYTARLDSLGVARPRGVTVRVMAGKDVSIWSATAFDPAHKDVVCRVDQSTQVTCETPRAASPRPPR